MISPPVPPEFHALDWYATATGWVASVALDRDTTDFAHLTGQEVRIDGYGYQCRSVERRTHSAPWRAGEPIGIVIGGHVGRIDPRWY